MEQSRHAEEVKSGREGAGSHQNAPRVFVFNPLAEGYIAHGKAFTPVRHQVALAEDLANLPQFLCTRQDVVLVSDQPSPALLKSLEQAGFSSPRFVQLVNGRIGPAAHLPSVAGLRPWAWGPDSVELLEPLFSRSNGETLEASHFFKERVAELYSKAWSASFLRRVLARCRESQPFTTATWLCSENEVGVTVNTVENALRAISDIRLRGHHRVVVKEAYGLAGHNSIRLWEPEVLPAQQKWLVHATRGGRQVVIEPWLEREIDFSVQLEMGPENLSVLGYTGLVNDLKGQFVANWANADYNERLPAQVTALFPAHPDIAEQLQHVYIETFALLETELRSIRFLGPVSIDAFVYRTPHGDCRLKPVVEINPRHTMGRLTIELMTHACPGTSGLFRLVNGAQAREAGFASLSDYAASLHVEVADAPNRCIRQGTLALNDPTRAKVCLATFQVNPALELPRSILQSDSR